jgi:hypothetical protein
MASKLSAGPLIPISLFGVSLTLFLLTVPEAVTLDSLTYVLAMLDGTAGELLHPHHLLYNVVGAALLRLTGGVAGSWTTVLILQTANCFVAAFAVVVCWWWCRLSGLGSSGAVMVSLWLTVMRAFWRYAAEVEVYNLALLLVLTAFAAQVSDRLRPAAPLLLTVACLFHQTAVFALIYLLLEAWLR